MVWSAKELDQERAMNNKYVEAKKYLESAVEIVGNGLIERGEDARLVVLAMVANEHVLLLGKPGK